MLVGLIACSAAAVYAAYRLNNKKREGKRFVRFIENATFQNIPFIKKQELGYEVFYFQEDKFSLEVWEKDGHFRIFVRDDELKTPVFIIEKNKNGLRIQHPTIFYYRTELEEKRGLFQAFIHRYIKGDVEILQKEEAISTPSVEPDVLSRLPLEVQDKVREIQAKYEKVLTKKDDLDIESYVLLETLIFQDMKQILLTYQQLSEESQSTYKEDVLQGLQDIERHLDRIEERFANDQVRELQKSLRIVKRRGEQ